MAVVGFLLKLSWICSCNSLFNYSLPVAAAAAAADVAAVIVGLNSFSTSQKFKFVFVGIFLVLFYSILFFSVLLNPLPHLIQTSRQFNNLE